MDEGSLGRLLDAYVAHHAARGPAQRSPAWYDVMATTVGGSELHGLLRARTPEAAVRGKVAALTGRAARAASLPLIWGTVFEDAAAAVAAAHLGARVRGEDLCVLPGGGLRMSPDGLCVLRVAREGAARGRRVRAAHEHDDARDELRAAVVEIKCPYSRWPDGAVPPQYREQLWLGLALAPPAHFALFVDCAFRACALAAAPGDYAPMPRDPPRRAPAARGLVALYADSATPELGLAPCRQGYCTCAAEGRPCAAGERCALEPVADAGAAPRAVLERLLWAVDRRELAAAHAPPAVAALDAPWDPAAEMRAARAGLGGDARRRLAAVLPWQLAELVFATAARRPGFLAEVAPAVAEVHALAAAAVASGAPDAWLDARWPRAASQDELDVFARG